MPAITLALLRHQAALVAAQYEEPEAFVRSLHHLLDFYADRTQRPGQSGEPPPLISAYRVPPPVLRQIQLELAPLADEKPESALALSDALWEQSYLEFRLLAASLLGTIPPKPAEPILSRVKTWVHSEVEDRLVNALLIQGLSRVRDDNPESLIRQVEEWLKDADVFNQQLGLRALLPLIKGLDLDHLPVFYRLLRPFARLAPAQLRPDLLAVLRALARRSPRETAYFLRQSQNAPNSADTPWLIRQCLAEFPPEIRESLRAAAREKS